jgi:hypothetical protein
VDEARWNACTDPQDLLGRVLAADRATDRKLLLLAAACCRRVWDMLADRRSRSAIEAAELHADGGRAGLDGAWQEADAAASELRAAGGEPYFAAQAAASAACGDAASACANANFARLLQGGSEEAVAQCRLIRCIFGPPRGWRGRFEWSWLVWGDGVVGSLALAAYEDRRLPEGTLEPDRLAVLADALEDAGCADAELLGHLRAPGPHVRGCFALDVVLARQDPGGVSVSEAMGNGRRPAQGRTEWRGERV